MSFRVELSLLARRNLKEIAIWSTEHFSAQQTMRLLDGFDRALKTLESDPTRFAEAAETEWFSKALRELVFGVGRSRTHRLIFSVEGEVVRIHAIRHFAQDYLSPDDVS